MTLEWTDDLKTGDEGIDADHREILERIRAFQAAYHAGQGEETLVPLMQYLEGYIERHFAEEEHLMLTRRYPALALHKQVHEEFKETFDGLLQRVRAEGPGVETVTNLYFLLDQWFRVHLAIFDTSMAQFIAGGPPD